MNPTRPADPVHSPGARTGPWVATAAAIGVLICAVAWPADTGLLLGAVVCLAAADWAARAGLRLWTRQSATDPTAFRCPTPETHNWGCPCDLRQRAHAYRAGAERLRYLGENPAARHLEGWAANLDRQLHEDIDPEPRVRAVVGNEPAEDRPDAPGPDPDATGQAAADQAGHHPDSIRTRPPEGSPQ